MEVAPENAGRRTTTRIKLRKCGDFRGKPGDERSFLLPIRSQPRSVALSASKAFASHYRLNAINFHSLRRCVKARPAIASAPPIHVLGSGTGAATTVSTMSLPSCLRCN